MAKWRRIPTGHYASAKCFTGSGYLSEANLVWSMIRSATSLYHKHLVQMRKTGIVTWARHLFNCHFKSPKAEKIGAKHEFWGNLLEISKTQPSRLMPQGWLRYGQHGARRQRLRPRPKLAMQAGTPRSMAQKKGNRILRKIGMNPTESSQFWEVNRQKDVNRF